MLKNLGMTMKDVLIDVVCFGMLIASTVAYAMSKNTTGLVVLCSLFLLVTYFAIIVARMMIADRDAAITEYIEEIRTTTQEKYDLETQLKQYKNKEDEAHIDYNNAIDMLLHVFNDNLRTQTAFVEFYKNSRNCSKQAAIEAVDMLTAKQPAIITEKEEMLKNIE